MILAFETSCDETAIAVMNESGNLLGQKLTSHAIRHKKLGGVLPELQSRYHLIEIDKLLEKILIELNIDLASIDYFCATTGPGLMGSLMLGATYAKTLAYSQNKPFFAISHLIGHALSPRIKDVNQETVDFAMQDNIPNFPYLTLLLSGGHSLFAIVSSVNKVEILGQTLDDSAGEAFDKTANLLGLGYPGGAKIEELAKLGDKNQFNFTVPLAKKKDCNLSFSGLKSSLRRLVDKEKSSLNVLITKKKSLASNVDKTIANIFAAEKQANTLKPLSSDFIADVAASFQSSVIKLLLQKSKFAMDHYSNKHLSSKRFAFVGGVAQNKSIRNALKELADNNDFECFFAKPKYCSDNAAMIAQVCYEKLSNNQKSSPYTSPIRPKWSIELA